MAEAVRQPWRLARRHKKNGPLMSGPFFILNLSLRLARQAGVRFGDHFAVFEVEGPGFRQQRANTREPASGLGGTIGDIRRLHDEAP